MRWLGEWWPFIAIAALLAASAFFDLTPLKEAALVFGGLWIFLRVWQLGEELKRVDKRIDNLAQWVDKIERR